MRRIERTVAFKRDYRRIKAAPNHRMLDDLLAPILHLLATGRPLPARLRDHSLSNDWNDHRECHIKPDLLLIYRRPKPDILQLVRLGSHSDLFGR